MWELETRWDKEEVAAKGNYVWRRNQGDEASDRKAESGARCLKANLGKGESDDQGQRRISTYMNFFSLF